MSATTKTYGFSGKTNFTPRIEQRKNMRHDYASMGYLDGISGKSCMHPENADYYRNWSMGFASFNNR